MEIALHRGLPNGMPLPACNPPSAVIAVDVLCLLYASTSVGQALKALGAIAWSVVCRIGKGACQPVRSAQRVGTRERCRVPEGVSSQGVNNGFGATQRVPSAGL